MSELRERMVQDMTMRGLKAGTRHACGNQGRALAAYWQSPPDQRGVQEIRAWLLYRIETRQVAQSTWRGHVAALRCLYERTLGRAGPVLVLPRGTRERMLPVVRSGEEVWALLDRVRRPTARMSLTLRDTCGLRVSEARRLRVEDRDSQLMNR
ncbi:MAG: hypothetical protein FJ280_06255 [Planctomycetes bacterium]|nr:hypothetical protein [Planctomycetota bacterium]